MRETWSSWSAALSAREAPGWNPRFSFGTQRVSRSDVAAERLARILARMGSAGASASRPGPLCRIAADITEVSGAGVMVLAGGTPQASLCTSGGIAALIEELQITFGEGPCIDAHRTGVAVAEPDLTAPVVPRWPAFSPKAVDAGARAIFGFPVRIGVARIGALNLYRDEPGRLSDDQHADALVMADVLARVLLAIEADAPPGFVPAQLNTELQSVVHQAAGMVSVQLDVSVGEA